MGRWLITEMKDVKIFEDSEFGKTIGFTKDKLTGVFWRGNQYVWIGFWDEASMVKYSLEFSELYD